MPVSMEESQSQEMCLEMFLKVATEVAERTDSGKLFQRDGEQECKALAPVLVLTPATDRLLSLFHLSEWDGTDAAA